MASAGSPRWLEVAPDRIAGWLGEFAARHGGLAGPPVPAPPDRVEQVTFRAADGTVAECHPPFPPLALPPGAADGAADGAAAVVADLLAAHAAAPRTVGVLLVRLGGYAAGVFGPGPDLLASKVGSRLVHGRSAAGGQSQQRFARRREKQSREALGAAARLRRRRARPVRGPARRGGAGRGSPGHRRAGR